MGTTSDKEPMTVPPPLIVFTDLDGTLLDHKTYRWDAARPALEALAALGIPVILASSKTAREITDLQRDMGLEGCPALVENGAGVIGLGPDTAAAAKDYGAIRQALAQLPASLRQPFEGFGDMSAAQVADVTGLDRRGAEAAKDRQFSEPGLWHGSPENHDRFLAALSRKGIAAREGGRFLTLSFGSTKADRMAEVMDHLTAKRSVALGDAPNDVEMILAADIGVIVQNPHREPLPRLPGEADGSIRRTDAPGPAGWNAAVLTLLEELKSESGTDPHG